MGRKGEHAENQNMHRLPAVGVISNAWGGGQGGTDHIFPGTGPLLLL